MATTKRKTTKQTSTWSKLRETAFLEHLMLSSNVAASERVALLTPGTAYRRRRSHPDFARKHGVARQRGTATGVDFATDDEKHQTLGFAPAGRP
jgi:hypothetical protein